MIVAIKNGDVQAFEQAYILYRQKLYAYFLKKTTSEEDAKDLLQITFSKLWQYRESLSEDYLFEQHLFHIARTVFIDFLRKENKQQKIKESIKVIDNQKMPEEYLPQFEFNNRLQKLLSGMPLVRKRVFELHKIEGYSYKEIAELLSISIKSVDNNLSKAMKYLRSVELIIIIFLINILH